MKILTASLFAIGIALASMSASKAMPVAPLDQAAATDTAAIPVAGGCDRVGIAGPLAVVARCTTVPPAGIPGRTAAVASATGKNQKGGTFPALFLFGLAASRRPTKNPAVSSGVFRLAKNLG